MNLITTTSTKLATALLLSFLLLLSSSSVIAAADQNNGMDGLPATSNTATGSTPSGDDCGWTFWDWLSSSGCSAPAAVQTTRPTNRPQVLCSTWCPSGYTRRDVTVGPTCPFYVVWGKCVDNTAYETESCGFASRQCVEGGGLSCQKATEADATANAHDEACYATSPETTNNT